MREHEPLPLRELFPDEHLYALKGMIPWYADLVNHVVTGTMPSDFSKPKRDKLRSKAKYYFWEDLYLWKFCSDQIIRRCVPDSEIQSILNFCHDYACGGHFSPKRTTRKVLDSGFYWPTLFHDFYMFCKSCVK